MSDEIEGEESDEEQIKGPKWPSTVFIDEGKLQFRNGNYRKAIENYDIVLEREPTNVKILVARSQAYYRLMDYAQAMRDAEDALKLDPGCPDAICQKGEIQYIMGDFEFAYLTFQRGSKKRPDYEKFRFGLQKCKATILNAIGPESNLKITDEDVKMVEERLNRRRRELLTNEKVAKTDGKEVDAVVNEFKSKTLLQKMEEDRKFFTGVLESKYIHHNVDPYNKRISNCSEKALELLSERREFWQMERPLHSRKRVSCNQEAYKMLMRTETPENLKEGVRKASKDRSKGLRKMPKGAPKGSEKAPKDGTKGSKKAPKNGIQKPEENSRMNVPRALKVDERGIKSFETYDDINALNGIDQYQESGPVLDDRTEESGRKKQQLLQSALRTLGREHEEIEDFESAIKSFMVKMNITNEKDLTDGEYNAIYDVGVEYISQKDHKRAIPIFEELLILTDTHKERGNILNAIGECQLILGDTHGAFHSVQGAVDLAKEIGDIELEMNSVKLLAEVQVVKGDMNSAAQYFDYVQELAVITGDTKTADDMSKRKKELGIPDDD